METFEIEEKIRTALIGDADLIDVLPLGAKAIFHYVAPKTAPKSYPIVIYKPIEDAPALAGDDCEFAHRVTLKIEIVAKERDTISEREKFLAAGLLVTKIIRDLGFTRKKSSTTLDDGKIISTIEFQKIILC